MALYQNYPYTDLQTLNLDGMLAKVQANEQKNTEQDAAIAENAQDISTNAGNITQERTQRQAADANLQAQINAIEAGAALDRTLNVDSKRQIIFITDSYGVVNSPCFCDKAASALDIPAAQYQLIAKGSAGFYRAVYDEEYTFIYMLQNASITLTPALVTDIVVCGGANDIGANAANLYAAIQAFANYCRASYINAKVWVMFTGYRMDISNTNSYVNCYNDYAYGCGLAGVYFHNLQTAIHSTGLLAADKIHPNSTGDSSLGRALALALAGGNPQAVGLGQTNFTMTFAAPVTSVPAYCFTNAITDGLIYFHCTGNQTIQFDDTTAVNCNGGTWYTLGTVTGGGLMINSSHTYATIMPVNVTIFFVGGDVLPAIMDLRVRAGLVQARFWCIKNGSWKNAAIDKIITGSGSFTLDPIRN